MQLFKNLAALVVTLGLWPAGLLAGPLADAPLTLKGSVPPNVLFALSVEYPTANTAAYQGASDYSASNEYLGYFDPKKCYEYNTTDGWFAPSSIASTHTCSGEWSGNFLNWATMTGLDEFRYAMTGGNRYRDTATETVLERTYQSGQGGTSNFKDKTFSGSGATAYPDGTSLTLKNQGQGTAMLVSASGSDVADCANPTLVGTTFGCTLTLQSNGDTASCASWTGTGTSASPRSCTSVATFSGGETFTGITRATTSTISTASDSTVTCTSPTINLSGAFSCQLALPNGHTATCTTWSGTGSAASPFTCTAFSTFSGGEVFTPNGTTTAATFTGTGPSGQHTDPNLNCTYESLGFGISNKRIHCPLTDGQTATCSSFTGTNPYVCTNQSLAWQLTGSDAFVSSAPSSGAPVVTEGSRTFIERYDITYTTATTQTYTYVSSYSGSTSTAIYYYGSTYNLSIGGNQTYNVRVKVCDNASGLGLEDNCKLIGSAYKPTGAIQDKGDLMRFGVFSYYNANDIDNAVMRSKLKYVAPQKYSSSGGTIANPNTEWSATDGTLFANPDSSEASSSYNGSVSNSGVINYINKFGSNAHTYKTYDNVGKLYYESLKYLRGLQPTQAFYEKARTATQNYTDDFPVITTWDDPIQYSCQKNYIISIGDTHTWCDKRLPGGAYSSSGVSQCGAAHGQVADKDDLGGDSGVNAATWTHNLGAAEGVGTTLDAPNTTGAGSASYYMSGLAYWSAFNDIRPDDATKPATIGVQKVKNYVIDVEEYGDLGVNSQYWRAAKYGGADKFSTTDPTTAQPLDWYNTIVLSGTTYNWPKTLLRAGDPLSMNAAVRNAFADIEQQIGVESALAQSSGNLDVVSGAYIYRAIYNSKGWVGDVQAYNIDGTGVIAATPVWTAASVLPSAANRLILTFNDGLKSDGTDDTNTTARTGVAFNTDGLSTTSPTFSERQRDLLNKSSSGLTDNLGADRVSYVRGDQTKEAAVPTGYGWRARTSLLGDIVNSNPVFVARAVPNLPDPSGQAGSYATFAKSVANRKPMVYVGGNDGMLHGFDASQPPVATGVVPGKELIAYVPSAVYSNLSQLMSPSYSHKYFVDGSPVVQEAYFDGSPGEWKTMLVGTLNAGGQGVFALDVTDPAGFSAALPSKLVLWEFTDRDDRDLGYTFSQPIIRRLHNGHWAVIFGNGFNNTTADGKASTTGRAYLYVLYVEGPGAGNKWVTDTNYFKIELRSPGESATLPLSPPNGLASPVAVDKNLDGDIDTVYVGDRAGNVWKIDISSATPSQWKSAFGTAPLTTPIFTATTAAGNAETITTGIELSPHPNGGYMLLFGTGSYIEVTDPVGPFVAKTDSYYGIWDKDDGATKVTRSKLQPQTTLATEASGGTTFLFQSQCLLNYGTTVVATNESDPLCPASIAFTNSDQQLGWVFDLPDKGERVVSSFPLLQAGILTFTTLTPNSDPCTGNTIGREYDLDYLTGGAPSAGVFDLNSDGSINATDDFLSVTGLTTAAGAHPSLPPSGRILTGGASDTPLRFAISRNRPSGGTGGTACTGFIPGWGCPGPSPRSCAMKEDVVSSEFLQGVTGSGFTGTRKCISAPSGRMSWRQIIR